MKNEEKKIMENYKIYFKVNRDFIPKNKQKCGFILNSIFYSL